MFNRKQNLAYEYVIYFDVNKEYTEKVQIKSNSKIKQVGEYMVDVDGVSICFFGKIEGVERV